MSNQKYVLYFISINVPRCHHCLISFSQNESLSSSLPSFQTKMSVLLAHGSSTFLADCPLSCFDVTWYKRMRRIRSWYTHFPNSAWIGTYDIKMKSWTTDIDFLLILTFSRSPSKVLPFHHLSLPQTWRLQPAHSRQSACTILPLASSLKSGLRHWRRWE